MSAEIKLLPEDMESISSKGLSSALTLYESPADMETAALAGDSLAMATFWSKLQVLDSLLDRYSIILFQDVTALMGAMKAVTEQDEAAASSMR